MSHRRILTALPAALLVLSSAACGSGSATDSTDETSASPDPAESPESPEAEGADADSGASDTTGEDFATLLTTLLDAGADVNKANNAKQFNNLADFPDGVSVGTFDQDTQTICVQDENLEIAIDFASGSEYLSLLDGLCGDGEELARLTASDDPDELDITGDEDLAQPVEDALKAAVPS